MKLRRLVRREIAFRRFSFAMACVAVATAVGCLVAQLTLVEGQEIRARRIERDEARRVEASLADLQDDYRKIMLQFGYNVLILSAEENLAEFHARGYPVTTMPEDVGRRLADSKTVVVRHLLPSLQRKLTQRDVPILLAGIRDEVPLPHRSPRKSLAPAVAEGEVIVGRVLADKLDLAAGDKIALLGRSFKVSRINPARGNADDITAWIDLTTAQELLDEPDRISAVLALSCLCVEAETSEQVAEAITEILPETQVIQLTREAAIRRATRSRASVHAANLVDLETAAAAQQSAARELFADWIVPVVVAGCAVWVGLLAVSNARDRRGEIGILRAMGLSTPGIVGLLLGRAVLVAVVGAAVGSAAGFAIGAAWADGANLPAGDMAAPELFNVWLVPAAIGLAALLAGGATLVPALLAARQDPADVLREA